MFTRIVPGRWYYKYRREKPRLFSWRSPRGYLIEVYKILRGMGRMDADPFCGGVEDLKSQV